MGPYEQVAAFILAGGASSRMGRDKGLLEIGGIPLIVRTTRLLEPLVAAVSVIGQSERYAPLGLRTLADRSFGGPACREQSQGPLAGIATALDATGAPWNLILACDLPYLTPYWLNWLLSRAMRSGAQAVVPRTPKGLEPLTAVYRRECAEPIAAAMFRGVRKVTEALAGVRMEIVDAREWRELDPGDRVLRNMNSPEDYEKALKWWKASAS
jgi:molybdopterin-guanine dinucleotide biosynthesis protein A